MPRAGGISILCMKKGILLELYAHRLRRLMCILLQQDRNVIQRIETPGRMRGRPVNGPEGSLDRQRRGA